MKHFIIPIISLAFAITITMATVGNKGGTMATVAFCVFLGCTNTMINILWDRVMFSIRKSMLEYAKEKELAFKPICLNCGCNLEEEVETN